jgi:2-oxo-4-hydroxy-4-carboxy-5-ureidoimidazoline decarboxylase
MTLAALNRMDRASFVATLGSIFEHSPWVAEQAADARPFASVDALHEAMVAAVAAAPADVQLALMRAHPELAGKAAIGGDLTAESTREQASARLDACTPEELARLTSLNTRYNARFGFPFILAVKGYDRSGIIAALEARLTRAPAEEHAENLRQIARIARVRLDVLLHD